MPVKKSMIVSATNNYATGIRKDDEITLPRGISGIVCGLEAKTSYLHVTLVGGTKGRLALGSEVTVGRMVMTDEEKDLDEMVRLSNRVKQNHESLRRAMRDGLNKLEAKYKESLSKGYINPIDFKLMADIKMDEMRWAVYEEIVSHAAGLMEGGVPEHVAYLRGALGMKELIESKMITRYGYGGRALSRSTSVISNLEDDMKREAHLEFLDDMKYMCLEGLWERVEGRS